jgi:2-dehydropantoate 2-reductase
MPDTPRIAIIGGGAMGSLLAYSLAPHAPLWLLDGWAAHVEQIRAHGITCEHNQGEGTHAVRATRDPAEIGAADIALVLVKSRQTAWAAEMAARISCGLVITLQNGVGNREILAAQLGDDRVGQAVTALGATLLGPGRVRHAGLGLTTFGAAPQPDLAQALAGLFNRAGLPADLTDDLDTLVWGKLVVNAGINALTALLRVPNGSLEHAPAILPLLQQVVAEAAAVAAARGIRLPYADPLAHVLAVARATGANHSSMLQDVLRGAPTEIDTINGAIAREGRRLGVATPTNQLLTLLVEAIDATHASRVG